MLLDGIQHIETECFYYTPLKEITIPGSVESLGKYPFPQNTIVRRPANYRPEGVLTADMVRQQFGEVEYIENITVPEGITKIDVACFRNMRIGTISLPNSLQELGWGAFSGCEIKSVTFPQNLQKIGDDCFFGSSIEKVCIP